MRCAIQHDPCLDFLKGWQLAHKLSDVEDDDECLALWKLHGGPFEIAATNGTIPAATTARGAAAALRKVLEFEDVQPQDANLIRAALAFLDPPDLDELGRRHVEGGDMGDPITDVLGLETSIPVSGGSLAEVGIPTTAAMVVNR